MANNVDCVFCKIVAGAIPATVLLDEADALAFLDIGPVSEGHTLLIPKSHYETLGEMPAAAAGGLLQYLPALAGAVQAATGCEGVNILQNNGRIAGQLVPHVHFHILPRNPGEPFAFNWPAGTYAEGRMNELAEAIRRNL